MNTNAPVDAALAQLDGLSDRPVAEHVDVFESIHKQLLDHLDNPPEAPDASPEPPRR